MHGQALTCTGRLWHVRAGSGMHGQVLACMGRFWLAQAGSDMHRQVLACTYMFWHARAGSGMHGQVPACIGRLTATLAMNVLSPTSIIVCLKTLCMHAPCFSGSKTNPRYIPSIYMYIVHVPRLLVTKSNACHSSPHALHSNKAPECSKCLHVSKYAN